MESEEYDDQERDTPAVETAVQLHERDAEERGHGEQEKDESVLTEHGPACLDGERHFGAAQNARGGEWYREPGERHHCACNVLRTLAQNRRSERARHTKPVLPAGAKSPDAERDMPGVVEHEKERDHEHGTAAESIHEECGKRGEWQPSRPHQPIADAAEWSTQRDAESLDLRGGHDAVHLDARERAHRDRSEIRMRVEVVRLAGERRVIRLARASSG